MEEKQLSLLFIADLFKDETEKSIVKFLFEEYNEAEIISKLIKFHSKGGKIE